MRFSALTEEDYADILDKFHKTKLEIKEEKVKDINKWLHYHADLFLLRYYHQYKSGKQKEDKEKLKQKVRFLYDRIHQCYPEFYEESNTKAYFVPCDMPSYYRLRKSFKALNEAGYPHMVMAFCYRNLIQQWSIERMRKELSICNLDQILDGFINQYAKQSEIPVFVVNLYFIDLKEQLNKRVKNILLKNDSVMPIRMEKYLNWLTGWTLLEFYYGKDPEHSISDWCNKVKQKAMKRMIAGEKPL